MRIHLCGAAGEVTGSGYLLETSSAKVLVDFGMFQGRDAQGRKNDEKNADLGTLQPAVLDAMVLTHAHLDHCGRVPMLPSRGMRCRIHATLASADLARLIMEDSAHIQESDAERANRRRIEDGRLDEPEEVPLYTRPDVEAVMPLFNPLPYEEWRVIAHGVKMRFFEGGHILGSAGVEMEVTENGVTRTIVFSGDIGPRGVPILRDPEPPRRADLVFVESTYGDRDHKPLQNTVDEFCDVIKHAAWNKAKVLIPAFAVGRTQLILYYLLQLFRDQRVPQVPIYLDSPMGASATALYRKHADILDEDMKRLGRDPCFQRELAQVQVLASSRDSAALNDSWEPGIIIASSGMCDGGRIMHHLKHNLWKKGVSVILAGYMGEGTLGRQLVDHRPRVRVLGTMIDVRATIHTLGGFSAHAGQSGLLWWLTEVVGKGKPRVVLTHGENPQREVLAGKIRERFGIEAERPGRGATVEFP